MSCVICDKDLEGRQRTFCSNTCKQKDKFDRQREKYLRATGRLCIHCHKDMVPEPVMGGYKQVCGDCDE